MGPVNEGSARFQVEALTIANSFPKMTYAEDSDGMPYVFGAIDLIDVQGALLDSYQIKIISSPDYPNRFPYVYETGGRIPINIDWHVFPDDGHCCIKAIPEEKLICKRGLTLPSFIDGEVIPYLYNQKFREENGYFLRERSHGQQGTIEFFQDVFNTTDLVSLAKNLLFVARGEEPNRVSKCFCGSSHKYRKCHRDTYRLLSQLSAEELIMYVKLIMDSPAFPYKED